MIDLDRFREDFALVFGVERAHRYANADEAAQMRTRAGKAVQEHMADPEWMACASAHFASMADAIRHDQARAERIRGEVRAEKMGRAA